MTDDDKVTDLTPFISRTKDEMERDEIASEIANARMTLDMLAYQNQPSTLDGRLKMEITRLDAERRLQRAYTRKNAWVAK